jgi:hypothetical protein
MALRAFAPFKSFSPWYDHKTFPAALAAHANIHDERAVFKASFNQVIIERIHLASVGLNQLSILW